MPGAVALCDQLVDRAVFPNQIMRRHLDGGIGQRLQRGLARRHASIMQDKAIRPAIAPPLAIVRRGSEAGDERTIRANTRGHGARPQPGAGPDRAAPWRELAMAREAWIDQYQARQ